VTENRPEFATNAADRRVADAINDHFAYVRTAFAQPGEVSVATAYFNPGGYGLLADELGHAAKVRLLLGAEPDPARKIRPLAESPNPARAARAQLRRALAEHAGELADARDLLGFTTETDATGRRLVDWLGSGAVEVRRLEDVFLHGKAFLVHAGGDDEGVIAGSSNFTFAGLATNVELNLGHYQPATVAKVRAWFDELWQRAAPYDLVGLYATRYHPHPPYLVYLRMLWERYGDELAAEADAAGVGIHLTTFQRDGLWRARRVLAQRHGVLVADEVGLGKTYLAGELIREAVQERRQRVLVIAPATLRDGPWRKFLLTYSLGVECYSFEQVTDDPRLNPEGTTYCLQFDPAAYALVVVDEAHNLRNPATQRAQAMRQLLAGSPPKDLALLTATPVNNSLWDLYYLLGYFLRNDAAFADVGIRSLRDHFARAMALNPDDLSPEHLFDILDAVAVRRTRPFVKRYYPHDTIRVDGREVPITFPTPRVLKVNYDLDQVLPRFFPRFEHALDGPVLSATPDPSVLSLARYSPSRYLLRGEAEAYEVQLAGLLRSGLLKRFESSAYAFARTCRTMANSHDAFLALLDHGKLATGAALADWVATDSDDLDEVDRFLDAAQDRLEGAADYDVEALTADVRADRDLLLGFAAQAESVTPDRDPKLAAVTDEIAAIAAQAQAEALTEEDARTKRKLLIFTYYADTVEWITDYLLGAIETDGRLACYRGRLTSITGTGGDKQTVLWGFAPLTTDPPAGRKTDLYDIVVTTDVLAEGVNLQQCRHIINYDLPWNPMRLVQRHGRVDRIASPHREVFLRCVFPDAQLDLLLGLEERLNRKINQAAAAIGISEVLPGGMTSEITYTESREEIERLRAGDATIFEQGGIGRGALSGEEYRQELRRALENVELAGLLSALPWGSGSGMTVAGRSRGYVFCARVGDHPRRQFRYVSLADPETPVVVADTLACLDHAGPSEGFETPRCLDEDTYAGAFPAWEIALADIVAQWNRAADPANLTPAIPTAMSRAVTLVREHGTSVMMLEDADRLVEALEAPYPERVLRLVRSAMAASADPVDQVRQIAQLARELGLQPSPPPEPLPEIDRDDVHLVTWLAITPTPLASPAGDPQT